MPPVDPLASDPAARPSSLASPLPGALTAALNDRYRIERELGAGGMATVYLAEDVRHRRKVAVKVLHPELSAVLGPERFLKEIEVTAGLQHPHILPLFDSGSAEGQLYYVMPYVEGETLRARLERETQLPVADALRITAEVADALDYAHRHGVVHRDIKPENILLHDGHVVVADFGIALAVAQAGGQRMTQTGLSLGTPQYMAPEQATGERAVDARVDVYALGAVMYEMLAGEAPFTGPSVQAIVARVLTETPRPLAAQRPSVPPHVDAAVRVALEKLPADRWPTAAAFAAALAAPAFAAAPALGTHGGAAPVTHAPAAARRRSRLSARRALVRAAVPLALAAGVWLGRRTAAARARPVAQLAVVLPQEVRLVRSLVGMTRSAIAIAPDGSRLVMAATAATTAGATRAQLYVRPLDRPEVTAIPGTEGGEQPFFSPDGAWIGFLQDGKLRKVPTAGGAPVTIAELPSGVSGLSWGPGDVIVFGRLWGPLMRISADGGEPQVVALPDSTSAESFTSPQVLPGGKAVLVTRSIAQGAARVAAVTLATGDTSTVVDDAATARYVHAGGGDRLLYTRKDGTVMVAPFDLGRRRVDGPAVPVAEGAQVISGIGFANVAVALDGTFAFQRGVAPRRELVIREPDGALTTLPAGVRTYRAPRLSPDGAQVAVGIQLGEDDMRTDVWTYDVARGTLSRLTFDGSSTFPEYTSDGRWVIYASLVRPDDRDLLRVRPGGGTPETLLAAPGQQHEGAVTPDGATLVYRDLSAHTVRDIWALDLTRPASVRLRERRALAATPYDERGIALSPDGRWLAYTSNASGRDEVYVRPVADAPERWQVSPSGGADARWDRAGHTLYYRNADTLFSVAVASASPFRLGARRALFTGVFVHDIRASYDVSPDGRRFLLLRELESDRPDEITVVLHALDAVGPRGEAPRP